MYFQQFFLGCLAHASYMLASRGEAVVVDPQRDVDIYLEEAARQGLAIRHIVETHLHADFVSGHKELATRTGANIYIGAAARALFPHIPLRDGDEISFGDCRMRVLETPGHTPESTCLLVFDPERGAEPWAVLTGDTLFIGDVGRPDLSPEHTPRQLAGMLFDSLHQKLLTLPDQVEVYPAHGAGSLCGKNMRTERVSTIGTERLTNYALQIATREQFICELTANLPARPEYFARDAELNRAGAEALTQLPAMPCLEVAEAARLTREGALVLDTRPADQFGAGHVPGAVNIGLSGQFASWAGAILGVEARPIIVAEDDERAQEARMRLARVGVDDVLGGLAGGTEAWRRAGLPLASVAQLQVTGLRERLARGERLQVLDVRRAPEWEGGHIEGAIWHPLDEFKRHMPKLDAQVPTAVYCRSGYRSSLATSLLLRTGVRHVINVVGGFEAWKQARLPYVQAAAAR